MRDRRYSGIKSLRKTEACHKLLAFSFDEIESNFLTVSLVFLVYAFDELFQVRKSLVSHVFVPIR